MRDISHCGTSRINQKSAQTKTRCECRTSPSLPNTSPNALIEVGDTVDIPNDQKCVGRAPWKGNLNSTSHCREGKDISTCHWHTERTSATRHGKEIRIRPAIVGEKNISACHRHTERTALWKGCLLERTCFASSEPHRPPLSTGQACRIDFPRCYMVFYFASGLCNSRQYIHTHEGGPTQMREETRTTMRRETQAPSQLPVSRT